MNKLVFQLWIFPFCITVSISGLAQDCLTNAEWEGAGTFSVPTDGSCDSPTDDGLTCTPGTGVDNISGTFTILSCAKVDFSSTAIDITGTLTIENGATMTTAGDLDIDGGTINVNGYLEVGDDMNLGNGAVMNVSSSGTVSVSGGVNAGLGFGGVGTINLNGTMSVSGTFNNNANGTLDGNGYLKAGAISDNGGDFAGGFTDVDCTDGSGECGDASLPVELLYFEASDREGMVFLEWKTASELNNKGFYVERGYNGRDFREIEFITGHGTITESREYSFNEPASLSGAYYRLIQEDYDGTTEMLGIRFVHSEFKTHVRISPNPMTDEVRISGDRTVNHTITVTDLSGKEVFKVMGAPLSEIEEKFNRALSGMHEGTYMMIVKNDSGSEIHKIGVH